MYAQNLTHNEFFEKLGSLFEDRKGSDHGAVHLSQKRLIREDTPATFTEGGLFPDTQPDAPLPLLVRATNGKSKRARGDKIKLSTVVEPHDLEAFYTQYADVCKAGMVAMKPRDRSKKKAKAKKKKTAA